MADSNTEPTSILQEETFARWSPLENEEAPCAVVSERMELIYLNKSARALIPQDWFAKRCWEVFPVKEEDCVWKCPTVFAVNTADSTTYCEETLAAGDGSGQTLGVAVVPVSETKLGRASAILVFCPKVFKVDTGSDAGEGSTIEEQAKEDFLKNASELVAKVIDQIP